MFNVIKTWIKDRIAFHKADKLAGALIACGIDQYVIDYVDGKIVLEPR